MCELRRALDTAVAREVRKTVTVVSANVNRSTALEINRPRGAAGNCWRRRGGRGDLIEIGAASAVEHAVGDAVMAVGVPVTARTCARPGRRCCGIREAPGDRRRRRPMSWTPARS